MITPDGKTVLFSPRGPGVFTVPLAGGIPRKLIDRFVESTQWVSPDGRRMFFATNKARIMVVCDLPDCTNATEVELARGSATSARWAPDSRGIAYIYSQDHRNLWEQPLDGSAPRALTHFEDARIIDFAWSADGKRLALTRGQWLDDVVLIKGLR